MVNSVNGGLLSYLTGLLPQSQQQTLQNAASPLAQLSATGQSSAYTLSLGQQQTDNSLLGYSSLGKLVNQTNSALSSMDSMNPAVTAAMGDGSPLQQSYAVSVSQLAQAQTVISQSYPSADQSVIPTGTLTIQGGSYSPADGSFVPSASPVSVTITDGSLNGVASAINTANNGITASVVAAADGGYQLQLTGETGAAAGFSLGGISALAFDPTNPSASGVSETQNAADAQFSVDGGPIQTSLSNSGAVIAPGVTANFTATGAMTVSVPFGLDQANGAAKTLVNNVNALIAGISQMTGSTGQLSGDTGMIGSMGKALDQALGQSFPAGTLAGIGITTQPDGSLSINPATLQSAYTINQSGTRAVLDQASAAVQSVLSGSAGAASQIQTQIQALVASLNQTTSLLSYLYGSTSGQAATPSLGGLFGGSDQTSQLLATMAGNDPSAQSSESQTLLAAELASLQSPSPTGQTGS